MQDGKGPAVELLDLVGPGEALGQAHGLGGVAGAIVGLARRRHRGCTPRQFLKRMRLFRAKDLLLRGDPGTTVTAAALHSGFSHLGQFSVDSRERFSESPSSTLRKARALSHCR